MTTDYSLADIAAATGNGGNNNGGWGDNWSSWIIIFLIFAIFGYGGRGFGGGFGGGSGSGAADNYVLASDFATIQRQLSDGFNAQERRTDAIINGICDLGYTQQSLSNAVNQNVSNGFYNTLNAITTNGYESRLATNAIGSQMAQCCCDIREGIAGVNYNMATQANGIARQLERGFADTNYNMAAQNCQTLQAIDKVGDRVIDYLANKEAQTLRDENFALRLSASQQAQNAYLVSQLGQKCPEPAYLVCNPNAPLNYSVNYGGCGCNG